MGLTPYEIRRNDRDFAIGDIITLQETLHTGAEMSAGKKPLVYTGWEQDVLVKFILSDYLPEGWAILTTQALSGKCICFRGNDQESPLEFNLLSAWGNIICKLENLRARFLWKRR